MIRLTLLVTGILSFLHFVYPQSFSLGKKTPDVLGISTIQTTANLSTVSQAIQIYCLNHDNLPSNLNSLYENELDKRKYLDLDRVYSLENLGNCEFNLKIK